MNARTRMIAGAVLAGALGCGGSSSPTLPVVVSQNEVAAAPAKSESAEGKQNEQPLAPGASFSFPGDIGGKLLEKLVAPADLGKLPPPAMQGPSQRAVPDMVNRPTQLNAPPATVLRNLPLSRPPEPRPSPAIERVPFNLAPQVLELPARIELPAGVLPRVAAPDPRVPAPLAMLARPLPDRASLEDPTADFSSRSVVGAPLPIRSTLAPFVKVNLPDPFENAEVIRLRLDIVEEPAKSLGSPAPPKK